MADTPDPGLYTRDTYEVETGKIHHTREDGKSVVLTQGDRFHPTLKQAQTGSLDHKTRKVKDGGRPASFTVGVDFDEDGKIIRDEPELATDDRTLDDLDMTSAARRDAEDAGLTVAEMEAVGATGVNGYITADVERALEARG